MAVKFVDIEMLNLTANDKIYNECLKIVKNWVTYCWRINLKEVTCKNNQGILKKKIFKSQTKYLFASWHITWKLDPIRSLFRLSTHNCNRQYGRWKIITLHLRFHNAESSTFTTVWVKAHCGHFTFLDTGSLLFDRLCSAAQFQVWNSY